MNRRNCKNGFTLIEVLIAILFVGLAIAALMGGNTAFTQANSVANEMSVAEFMTEQIRERTAMTAYASLQPLFDNVTYSPPINAKGDVLSDFAAFSQTIVVQNVNNSNFTQTVADGGSNFIRVTVTINFGAKQLSSTSWIRANY